MPLPAGALRGPGPPSPQGHLGLTTDPTEGATGANMPKEVARLHAALPTSLSSLSQPGPGSCSLSFLPAPGPAVAACWAVLRSRWCCILLGFGRREALTLLSRPCLWGRAAPLSPVSLGGLWPVRSCWAVGSMGGHCSRVSWPPPLISQSAVSPESLSGGGGCSGGVGAPLLGEGIPMQEVHAVC